MPTYCSLAELKTFLSIPDGSDDTVLTLALEAAARMIDEACGRRFYLDEEPSDRYYTQGAGNVLFVDDIGDPEVTVGADDGNDGTYDTALVEGTDFNLRPYQTDGAGGPRPYTSLERRVGGNWSQRWPKSVRVTARWGWPAIPGNVAYANLIQASSLFKRKDAPFGIVGSPDLGVGMRRLARLDADVEALVGPLRRGAVRIG